MYMDVHVRNSKIYTLLYIHVVAMLAFLDIFMSLSSESQGYGQIESQWHTKTNYSVSDQNLPTKKRIRTLFTTQHNIIDDYPIENRSFVQ